MSALPIIITTAGLNALPNAQNTGVSNVVIASMGVSPTQIAATAATNAIPGEVKRIAGVSGQVVADDQIYISAADQTEDTYVVRTIGLYLDTGVLFAVYSQAAPLLEKAGPAMAVLEAAIKLSSPQANAIAFTGGGWLNPQASETVQGVVRLATEAEAKAGTNTTRAVTPKGLKSAIDVVVAWINQEFNGIAQALADKAAVVHTHVMGDITGLGAALAAKAAATHTHVMGDITGLVDALNGKASAIHTHAMSSIDGLTNALAGKAAAAHTHVMSEISGLAEALAGKAAAAHTHVMGDIAGLVTALGNKAAAAHGHVMADVDGLVQALSGKSAVGHKHDASDTISGAFDVARIPALAMEKITGLANALATKAPRHDPDFTGDARLPAITMFKKEFPDSVEGGQLRLERPDTGTTLGGHVVIDVKGDNVRIYEEAEPYRGVTLRLAAQRNNESCDFWTTSNLLASSQVEATTGTATDRFITPAALFSFARNLGSTGYAVIPGTGLMIQWGLISSSISEGVTHAGLPVAFGGGCLVALAIPRNPGAVVTADWYMQMGGKYQDRIVFYANRANGGTGSMDGYEWLALGRVSGSPDPTYSSGGGGGGGGGNPEIAP